jgi:hypothetical protein
VPIDGGVVRVPPEVETAIKEIGSRDNPSDAALVLAAIANRAAAALHQLARVQSSAHRGQPDWGRWASLVNVSRDAVLRTATSRQTAAQLARGSAKPSPAEVRVEESSEPPGS